MSEKRIEIIQTTYKHLRVLAKNIRPADEREARGFGLTPIQLLVKTIKNSNICNTVLVDGEVAAIYGIAGSLLGYTGIPFFLTSKVADTVSPRAFFSLYSKEFKKLKGMYPTLEQFVDCSYIGALRLLKMIGFSWNETQRIKGLNGVEYYYVTYRNHIPMEMKVERFSTIKDEIMELAEAHGDEFTYHKDLKGEVDPNWDLSDALEKNNKLFACTLRDDNKLIGYFIFFLTSFAHYKSVTMAYEDTFYVAPEYRGKMIGYKFLKFAVEEMKKTGAQVLRVANKAKADYEALWNRLGFEREEIVYTLVNT